MGGRLSHASDKSFSTVSNRGDVKSESYRYLRTTYDRTHDSKNTNNKVYETTAVLNHCFDDIEKFCARLKHVATAAQELDTRRRYTKGRKNRKKLDDSILTLRATPPSEAEFIDIFQKIKLAVNLTAKLKCRLRDPSAIQLINYLLPAVILLANVSKDKFYSSNMANRAVAPLLTREALNVLKEAFTIEEFTVWQSLGPSWFTTKEDWTGYVAPFYPIFYNGWAPDFPSIISSTPVAPIRRRREIADSL